MANVNEWSPLEDGNTSLDQYSLERQISPESELNRYTKKIMAAVKAKADAMQAEIDALAPMDGVVHITGDETVGGVKTFEEPIVGDVSVLSAGSRTRRLLSDRFADAIDVADYGALGSGGNDFLAIEAAIAAGAAAQKPLRFAPGKTYVVAGARLEFKSGAEFNGATLDVSGMTGPVCFNSPGSGWVEDEQAKTALKTADIEGNSANAPGWSAYYGISKHYVKIYTNQYYYTYNGTDENRYEINYVTDRGSFLTSIAKAIDKDSITKVKKLARNPAKTIYKNVVFNIGNRASFDDYVGICKTENSSNIKVENVEFNVPSGAVFPEDSHPILYEIDDTCDVEVDGINFNSPLKNETSNDLYCVSMEKCYNVVVKNAIGQGSGWGACANNSCWNIVFENCDFNIIDFHQPFRGFLKIYDCNIGFKGISLTAVGDLYIKNTTFTHEATNEGEYIYHIIRARDELCGICDGAVTIEGCKIINHIAGAKLFASNVGTIKDALKPGSPLTPVFWHTIKVKNLAIVGSQKLNLAPQNKHLRTSAFMSFENITGSCEWRSIYDSGYPYYASDNNKTQTLIILRDFEKLSDFININYASDSYITRRSFVIDNARQSNSEGVSFVFNGRIDAVVSCSDVKSIADISSSSMCSSFKFVQCKINKGLSTSPFVFANEYNKILFEGCDFIEQPLLSDYTGSFSSSYISGTFIGVFGHIVFKGNNVVGKSNSEKLDVVVIESKTTPADSPANISLPSGVDQSILKNRYVVSLGSGGEYENLECTLPRAYANRSYAIDYGTCKLSRNGATDPLVITISGTTARPVRRFSVLI